MDAGNEKQLPSVVAVVLTWNDTEMTSGCLASLLENDYPRLHVILVDNGSTQPCGVSLENRFPSIELLVLPENRGFTGGANAGLRRAQELEPDYIFFLNNDTIVGEKAVSALVRELEQREQAGAAHALLLNPPDASGVLTCQFYTSTLDREAGQHFHSHMDEPIAGKEWPVVESDFIPASALMLRACALKDVGLFDETLGTNWEDYDLCVRFANQGWRLIVVGDARVIHLGGATTGRHSPYITYYYTRNRLICIARYARPRELFRRLFYVLRVLTWYHVKEHGFNNWACHLSTLRGVFDFMIGVRGVGHPPRNRRG